LFPHKIKIAQSERIFESLKKQKKDHGLLFINRRSTTCGQSDISMLPERQDFITSTVVVILPFRQASLFTFSAGR
jgi:hypothetical protein